MKGAEYRPLVRGESPGRDYVSGGRDFTVTLEDSDRWYNDGVWAEAPLKGRDGASE